ncbi:DsbA family protein [Erythrobacter sp. Alg231-14]|uniref:DsbA family protein n=1 Tax=Erythrobacter sp. Alg231-14 TaxID=1922225 RepID=UPI000D55777C
MDALKSDAPLIVYIDVKSPYGFVAVGPTLQLEKELGMQFDWRPLTLNIPSYLGSARKKDGKVVASQGRSDRTWKAIKYSYHDARRYAERQGLTLKGTEKIWDSRIANIAILWVARTRRSSLPTFLELVFPAFWKRELDIEDMAVIETCLDRCGVSSMGFREFCESDGRDIHDAYQSQFHDAGIYGVPTFVLNSEVFHGREHLPYLRWALSGGHGNPPDIAYEVA